MARNEMENFKEKDIKTLDKRLKAQTSDDFDDRWVETPEAISAVEAAHSRKQEKLMIKERPGTRRTTIFTRAIKRSPFGNDRRVPLLVELRAKITSLKEANDKCEAQKEIVENYKNIVNDKIKLLEQKQDEIDALTIKNNKLAQAIVKIKETMNENIDATEAFCDNTRNNLQQFKELNIGKFEQLMNDLIDEFPYN